MNHNLVQRQREEARFGTSTKVLNWKEGKCSNEKIVRERKKKKKKKKTEADLGGISRRCRQHIPNVTEVLWRKERGGEAP